MYYDDEVAPFIGADVVIPPDFSDVGGAGFFPICKVDAGSDFVDKEGKSRAVCIGVAPWAYAVLDKAWQECLPGFCGDVAALVAFFPVEQGGEQGCIYCGRTKRGAGYAGCKPGAVGLFIPLECVYQSFFCVVLRAVSSGSAALDGEDSVL